MGDREAEPSCSGIDFSYTQRSGEDENQFRLRIDGRCAVALGVIGLAALYLSSPENKARVAAALSNALERVGEKIGNITSGSLVMVLHCSSSESFLRFWENYQLGKVKKRLSEEFSKIGIEEVTVEIENIEQVIKKIEVIRDEISKECGSSGKTAHMQETMSTPQEKDLSIYQLHASTIFNMYKKLNIQFRRFAAEINMSFDDINLISQNKNPTEEIFRWWDLKKEATVINLRKVLERMKRDDILEILDKDPKVQAFISRSLFTFKPTQGEVQRTFTFQRYARIQTLIMI